MVLRTIYSVALNGNARFSYDVIYLWYGLVFVYVGESVIVVAFKRYYLSRAILKRF